MPKVNIEIGGKSAAAEKAVLTVSKQIEALGGKMTKVGGTLSKSLTLPLLALGGAAIAAGLKVDEALDAIANKTGATGKELDGLTESFKKVGAKSPVALQTIAEAMADLHVRTGLEGKALEDLTLSVTEASRIMGIDASEAVRGLTRTMGNWNIGMGDSDKTLNILFATVQQTGIPFGRLNELLTTFGPTLSQMGFSLTESAALLGQFEKEGVNTEGVLAALRIGIVNFAKAGEEAPAALARMIDSIKNAETASDATRLAIEMFGGKAGAGLAVAIREGRLSVDDLAASLDNSEGSVQKTIDATWDFSDAWGQTKNNVILALEPIGTKLLMLAADWLPKVTDALKNALEGWNNLSDSNKDWILIAGGVVLAIGPVITILGNLTKAVGFLTGGVHLLSGALAFLVANPIVAVIAIIAVLIGAIYVMVTRWDEWKKGLVISVKSFAQYWVDAWNMVTGAVRSAWNSITGWVQSIIDAVKRAIDWLARLLGLNVSVPVASGRGGTGSPTHTGAAEGGKVTQSGWSWVGEKGPEPVWLPQGAEIWTNDSYKRLPGSASGGISVLVTGNQISSDYDIDRIGERLVRRLIQAGVVPAS